MCSILAKKYNIAGPSVPVAVVGVNASMGPLLSSAVILWTVPSLAYTPEHYTVLYGKNPVSLDERSQRISGGYNLNLANEDFNVSVSNLEVGSRYYYEIMSSNSEGTISSGQYSFTAGNICK